MIEYNFQGKYFYHAKDHHIDFICHSVFFFIFQPVLLVCSDHCTEYHRLSVLNSRSMFSHSSRVLKLKTKVLIGLVLMRPLFLTCRHASPCVLMRSPFVHMRSWCSVSYKGTSLSLNYFKYLISKYSHIGSQH